MCSTGPLPALWTDLESAVYACGTQQCPRLLHPSFPSAQREPHQPELQLFPGAKETTLEVLTGFSLLRKNPAIKRKRKKYARQPCALFLGHYFTASGRFLPLLLPLLCPHSFSPRGPHSLTSFHSSLLLKCHLSSLDFPHHSSRAAPSSILLPCSTFHHNAVTTCPLNIMSPKHLLFCLMFVSSSEL